MARVDFWQTIAESLAGKAKLRLILQPAMALLLGARLGIADARQGRMPFIRRLATSTGERWQVFKHSFREALLPLALAFIIDAVVQYMLLRTVRPIAAVVVGLLLVWLPLAVARALANRAWTHAHQRPRRAGASALKALRSAGMSAGPEAGPEHWPKIGQRRGGAELAVHS